MKRLKFKSDGVHISVSSGTILFHVNDPIKDVSNSEAQRLLDLYPGMFEVVESGNASPPVEEIGETESSSNDEPETADPMAVLSLEEKAAYTRAEKKLADGKALTDFEASVVDKVAAIEADHAGGEVGGK